MLKAKLSHSIAATVAFGNLMLPLPAAAKIQLLLFQLLTVSNSCRVLGGNVILTESRLSKHVCAAGWLEDCVCGIVSFYVGRWALPYMKTHKVENFLLIGREFRYEAAPLYFYPDHFLYIWFVYDRFTFAATKAALARNCSQFSYLGLIHLVPVK